MNNNSQDRYRLQEEQSTQQRAAILGLAYFDTKEMVKSANLVTGLLSNEEMYTGKLVPLRDGDNETSMVFGITSSTPQSTIKALRERFGEHSAGVEFVMISLAGFREYMRRFDPPKEVVYEDVRISQEGDSDTLKAVSETLESVRTDDILSYLIEQADRLSASDIHIENQRTKVRIRLRVDGILHPIAEISHDKYRVLQASIATKANISTASQDAQSGHMQHVPKDQSDRLINMRIETVPTNYGQDAVIRLFNFDESLLDIERLSIDDNRKNHIKDLIQHPHGMLMVVGPTGSGKSTTLYSIVNALNNASRKIITLEDPVEVALPGVTQIPVNTTGGKSFADKLRAVLRLDPDVVMVGEIRDADTARTAIQASITGHLVLTTFHAASAAAAFARMIDMIGQNPVFTNAIRMVLAQRLVRRLDDETKIAYTPDEATRQWLKDHLGQLPDGFESPDIDAVQLYKPGSSPELPFGYSGRIMLMEQLIVDEEVQKFIRGDLANINVKDIESVAHAQGMLTMQQDGILRVLRGETTLDEINRVL